MCEYLCFLNCYLNARTFVVLTAFFIFFQFIMAELLQTERTYVKDLDVCINTYLSEFRRQCQKYQHLPKGLNDKEHTLFGNIEEIFKFHNK